MPADRPRAPRTLADALRARSEASLVRLLRARPDLAVPPPPDLGTLATRAASRPAVRHVLDTLSTAHLQVLEVLAVLPEPCTAAGVARTWGAPAAQVLADLDDLALVWGTPRALHLVRTVRDMLGPHPAGLGPPLAEALDRRSPARLAALLDDLGLPAQPDPPRAAAALAAHLGSPGVLTALLAQAPPGTRDLLDRLVWGPPVGAVADADREVRTATLAGAAASPVDWLLAHGVLAVADAGHVVLPREIGLALRGGRVHAHPSPTPPALPTVGADESRVAASAAAAAAEAVRLVGDLAQAWSQAPPGVLRAGGVGVRELRRTAQVLDVDPRVVAVLVEVALAAGLIADDGEADPRFAPTPAYDLWLTESTGRRWTWLADAWLSSPAAAHLVGARDARDAVVAAGSPATHQPGAAALREEVLGAFAAGCAPGRAAEGGRAGLAAWALTRATWSRPRRPAAHLADAVAGLLEEAELLGLLALGAPAPTLRAVVRDDRTAPEEEAWDAAAGEAAWDAAAQAVDAALPPPVDHLLLQADLTAVAPGPLVADLQATMDTLADVDSRGGATVYRFSAASVRRGLDLGMSGEEILGLLRAASRTGVPQPLEYLVADVARRHGTLRVGAAQSFVRTDDVAALDELIADRRAARLGLRRLAPTVACSPLPAEDLLAGLRAVGLAPAAEGPAGQVLLTRPTGHRADPAGAARRRPGALAPSAQARPAVPRPSAQALTRMIRALRAAEDAVPARASAVAPAPGAAAGPIDPATLVAALRLAADRRASVWASLVEADGHSGVRLLEPLTVEGGLLTALDPGSGRVRSFPLHRIRGVSGAAPAPS
ncbi:MAG: helicase-associated domain-containing protein [Kineosporiaceae bacterium]